MSLTAGKYWSIRRLTDRSGFFKMVAVDQRPPIMQLVQKKRGVDQASYEDVAAAKISLTKVLAPHASAVLLDPIWAWPNAHSLLDPAKGVVITLEEHAFAEDEKGRRSSNIADWSVAKIKAMGGDAVKALAWYRPDGDPETCKIQQDYVEAIGAACRRYDICFLLELLTYPLPGEQGQTKDYIEHNSKNARNVLDSVREFADPRYGVDIFKLESPVPAPQVPSPGEAGSDKVQALFDEMGQLSPVPWVMLSAGANMGEFERVMHYAYRAGASGYLAGRAIWLKAMQNFPDMAAVEAELTREALPYMDRLNHMTDEMGTPWFAHRSIGGTPVIEGAGPDFPKNYAVAF
ncbi:tagatose 1,6-diphosphate aldolase [Consotaella salsifontis]|uniref:Tagatose 1,6-diphosphate aldolase n=1 Tax=Consotaella salsifontis TaxID=1365950 RepID=A0A1T4SIC8_9HYPH|nr:tagatose 1,6-diphosphate aldolase [Consotaella salsifontis]SKA27688.1 tagatose 1,6-diphosphate aldolase [Consotaella salsifontis]